MTREDTIISIVDKSIRHGNNEEIHHGELEDARDGVAQYPGFRIFIDFEDILKKLFSDLVGLDQNPIELLFYHVFDQNGWQIERTPLNRSATITRYKVPAIASETGIKDELFGAGVPDFFLWDSDGRYRFVEVKASEDELNSNQLEWATEYDCKFYIAQLASVDPELTDEEILERNRIQ